MGIKGLALANLRYNRGRTVGLCLLVAALACVAVAGCVVTASLQNGLSSLEARLGADILVAPDTARSKVDLEEVLVEGVPAGFYMDDAYVGRIAEREGVEKVSAQYYLATVKAGCCSMPVQIIGFDPQTDFSIQPWVARTFGEKLGRGDVLTGANITGTAGSTIMFYGVECRIVGRLAETGTALDNAVFADSETVRDLIEGSGKQGLGVLEGKDPDEVVSTIQVKVADGASVAVVADDINLHVRGVTAVPTKTMTSGVADGVSGASHVIGTAMALLCLAALVVLVIAFNVAGKHRTREFAVLRLVGASRAMLGRLVVVESAITSVLGALAGIAVALGVLFGFKGAIEQAFGLPFLLPGAPEIALVCAGALLAAVLAGSLASLFCARRLAAVDAGQTLREG